MDGSKKNNVALKNLFYVGYQSNTQSHQDGNMCLLIKIQLETSLQKYIHALLFSNYMSLLSMSFVNCNVLMKLFTVLVLRSKPVSEEK